MCKKSKTSILNPFQHIKLNQAAYNRNRRNRGTEICQRTAAVSGWMLTEKDMASFPENTTRWIKNLDILDSQDMALKEQLEKDAVAFQEEKLRPKPENIQNYWMPESRYDLLSERNWLSSSKVLLVNIMTITIVISQPMKWMISIWKIPIASLIVPGNLNIRGNRNCKKTSCSIQAKSHNTEL